MNLLPPLHRVLMNVQLREKRTVQFLEVDCKTALWGGPLYDIETVDQVREILVRSAAAPAVSQEFAAASGGQASIYLDLTDEQCARLKRGV